MNLYLKKKPVSAYDRFTVYDEAGNERYTVKGTLSRGRSRSWRFRVYDLAGTECAVVQSKELSSPPCYTLRRGGVDVGDMTLTHKCFPQTYTVRGLGWQAVQKAGEFYENDCEFTDGERTVVVVSKQWRTWGETYEIRISPDVNELDALMVALVFDACNGSV